jgi:hypothetical protein
MDAGGISAVVFAILFLVVGSAYAHKLWTEGAFNTGSSLTAAGGIDFLSLMVLYLPNTLFAYGFIADLMNSQYHYSVAGITALVGMLINKMVGGPIVDGIVTALSFLGSQFAKLPVVAQAAIGAVGVGAAAAAAPAAAAAAAAANPFTAPAAAAANPFTAPAAAAAAAANPFTAPAAAAAAANPFTAPAAAAAAANPFGAAGTGLAAAAANPFGAAGTGLAAAANPFTAPAAAAAAALPEIAAPAAAAAAAAPVVAAAAPEVNPFAEELAGERAAAAAAAREEAAERRRAEPGANPFLGGRRKQRGGATNMCSLPGFEWLENTVAPQGIVMSMTVLWYLLIELWDTGRTSQSLALGVVTGIVFIVQGAVLYKNNCLAPYKYGIYSILISLVMAVTFASSSYFIQKSFLSGGSSGSTPPPVPPTPPPVPPTPSPVPATPTTFGPQCPDGTVIDSSKTMCLPILTGAFGKKVSVGGPNNTSAPVNDDDQFVCEAYKDGELVTSTIVD